ncbi:hypothetical protein CAPTEDRAFT_110058 [Capitella teleta]|uniref:Alkylated DNA repair protein AlkB homologue 8 N-terminal domain-containing protein n=1 Tax=Capitella teleta TaxID=283909 RepID=R7TJ25_CAPTE|nr:hypothetical protein CAPTEDRAFT_110058 [Capitella teleta]|eukprot:ELT93714.1 hypothetical protein CAPTEDRAFT_110058 [Capitella teleta]
METKEVCIDFRTHNTIITPIIIKGQPIEQVTTYKYLGITIQSDLRWTSHISTQCKKASAWLYYLRKLRQFHVDRHLQELFFIATIDSLLLFGMTVWGGRCTARDRNNISRVQRIADKIMNTTVQPWGVSHRQRTIMRAKKIIREPLHPLHYTFQRLPSYRRYRALKAKNNRLRQTFVPSAITH